MEKVGGTTRPVIRLADGEEIVCDYVLGFDGFDGVTRAAVKGASCSGVKFGAEWLALLAQVPPSAAGA